jgi:hypothetical protein
MRTRSGDASEAGAACDGIEASVSRLLGELQAIRERLTRA